MLGRVEREDTEGRGGGGAGSDTPYKTDEFTSTVPFLKWTCYFEQQENIKLRGHVCWEGWRGGSVGGRMVREEGF